MNILSPKKLKIEMVHDINCSWCPIGYNNIKTAIIDLNIDVDFHFMPFELNPNMANAGEPIASYFSRQMGWNEHKLLEYQGSLVTTAAKSGVCIDFSKRTHYYNTHNAHLLMHWAERFDKQIALNEALIEAYFKEGQDISNLTVLLNIAEELGFDREKTNAALTSTELNQELSQELAHKVSRIKAFNIRSIPTFIVNENTLISGSNSVQYFKEYLSDFIKESSVTKVAVA
ncbi:MAG: DsbA family protein [Colwellia sp.]|nr:DsbA family protein [Colwellia sp.]